ncbi:MAG: hypothetical protein AAF184_14665 [Pseudomonadota bacterium]
MSLITPARRRLHAASQWLARLAYAFADPREDDSHSALLWREGTLETDALGTAGPAQLDAVTLALTLAGRTVPLADLDERQRHDAVIALLAMAGLDGTRLEVALPWSGEAPDADVEAERALSPKAVQSLAILYEDASRALTALADASAHASPVRLWPHHFDIATLITAADPFESVGVGLAPDDEHIDAAYWYVAPWPAAQAASLPPAPAGWRWQRDGFSALVAPREDGHAGGMDAEQLQAVLAMARQASPGQQGGDA